MEMKFIDPRDEKEMVSRFRAQVLARVCERKRLRVCSALAQLTQGLQSGQSLSEAQGEEVKKMIRRYSKAKGRNHFGLSVTQDVESGLYSIISSVRQASSELSSQLAKAMDKAVK